MDDTRRAWARSASIGASVAMAVIVVWSVGTAVIAPALAASPANGRAQKAVIAAERQAARHLAEIVAAAKPLLAEEAVHACLAAGSTCGGDALLDVDTTRLRAMALGSALGEAVDPHAPGYLGRPTQAGADLAGRTVSAANAVAQLLGQWLTTGCGSTIDGIPVTARPAGCDGTTEQATQALAELGRVLQAWPAA